MGQVISGVSKDEVNQIFNSVIMSKDVSRADFKLLKLLSINEKSRSKVYLVERYSNKQRYAMKVMDKFNIYNNGRIKNVIQAMQIQAKINHPFILKVLYAFQDDINLFIITEYCKGGDLSYQMKFHDVFTEKETIFIISCLILALETIHKEKIINVGLCLEHILLDQKGYPKITDFQHAIYFDNEDYLNQEVLNNDLITDHLAPEILLRQTPGIEADFYSLGIVMCYMMSGKKNDENTATTREQLINNILKKNIKNVKQSDLPEGWQDYAGDFINKLTQKKPQNRLGYYGSEELKKHKWLQNEPWQKIEEGIIIDCYIPKIKNVDTSAFSNFFSQDKQFNQQKNEKEKPLPHEALKLMETLEFQEEFEQFYYSIDEMEDQMIDEIKSFKSSNKNYQQIMQQQQINDIESDKRSNQQMLNNYKQPNSGFQVVNLN